MLHYPGRGRFRGWIGRVEKSDYRTRPNAIGITSLRTLARKSRRGDITRLSRCFTPCFTRSVLLIYANVAKFCRCSPFLSSSLEFFLIQIRFFPYFIFYRRVDGRKMFVGRWSTDFISFPFLSFAKGMRISLDGISQGIFYFRFRESTLS